MASRVSLEGVTLLEIDRGDIAVCAITLVAGTGVVYLALATGAGLALVLLAHLAVAGLAASYFARRAHEGGEVTVPLLLSLTTLLGGPIGSAGCLATACWLRKRQASPQRLQGWYDYIAGVVARDRFTRIHEDLQAGRLANDVAARVRRFQPVLTISPIDQQQRVLGMIGRRYHGDFRPVLKNALRHRNGLIRTQAAAIASKLDLEEKNKVWSERTHAELPAAEPPRITAMEPAP